MIKFVLLFTTFTLAASLVNSDDSFSEYPNLVYRIEQLRRKVDQLMEAQIKIEKRLESVETEVNTKHVAGTVDVPLENEFLNKRKPNGYNTTIQDFAEQLNLIIDRLDNIDGKTDIIASHISPSHARHIVEGMSGDTQQIMDIILYNMTKLDQSIDEVKQHHKKNISGCQINWEKMNNGTVPINAVPSDDTGKLYVGRVLHENELIPGKIDPLNKCAYIGYRNEVYRYSSYQALTLTNCAAKWVSTRSDTIPSDSLEGGYTDTGEILYVGRAFHDGQLVPGKVQLSEKLCFIPYRRMEIGFTLYDILTVAK